MSKKIVLFTLGGTIAYLGVDQTDEGKNLTGEDLIEALPLTDIDADITVVPFLQKASSSLSINDIISLAQEVNRVIEQGVDGIVITQGTDTIEESAFMLDLLVHRDIPVVVTGAMRNPTLPGADGPANLFAAIKVAVSEEAKNLGTLVVFNDEIHSSWFVRKTHTQNVAAFQSDFGRLGWVSEGHPRIIMKPNRHYPSSLYPLKMTKKDSSVALLTCSIDDDGRMLDNLTALGYQALVMEGLGGGHVPTAMVDSLIELVKKIPVILATRTGRGEILTSTYKGYQGSETYLLSNGLISAGWLDSRKSKVLLHLLLRAGKTYDQIREAFTFFAR